MSDLDHLKENLRKKAISVHSLLTSPEGKGLMKALEEEFDGVSLKADNPYETYYRLGQRDVVMYLKQLVSYVEKEHE